MPKHRRTSRNIIRRDPIRISDNLLRRQLTSIRENGESALSLIDEESNDPMLTYVKLEVKEEDEHLELNSALDLKIEQIQGFQEVEEYASIKEESSDPEVNLTTNHSAADLDVIIEWALNLQFEHGKQCKGRLYPCKDICETFTCKIVVLSCTVCKKQMLHTLKDWTMPQF